MSISLGLATRGFQGGGGESADAVNPTIAVVSPTPSVQPGDPGGFSDNPEVARVTPIVIDITDVNPGVQYIAVFVKFVNISNHIEVIYRRGQFEGLYAEDSSSSVIANGLRLTIMRTGGWIMASGTISSLVFEVDALDAAGNLQ